MRGDSDEVDRVFDDELLTFGAIGLGELDLVASLRSRRDRKYLVAPQVAAGLLAAVHDETRALDVSGVRTFGYESLYFDTADLRSFRSAAHGHRRRFKVRTRRYLDVGTCVLEVKTKGLRGRTVKQRVAHAPDAWRELDELDRSFVDHHTGVHDLGHALEPVLTTRYDRSTLVDRGDGSRVTFDRRLGWSGSRGGLGLDGLVVVETKSTGASTAADRWLWRFGFRPLRISKYCAGLALLDPDLPRNRWHRALSGHLEAAADSSPPRPPAARHVHVVDRRRAPSEVSS